MRDPKITPALADLCVMKPEVSPREVRATIGLGIIALGLFIGLVISAAYAIGIIS